MSDKIFYKNFKFDLKRDAEEKDGRRIVCGYGSTYEIDQGGDQVMPGAFEESIKSRNVRFLYQHRPDMIIGKVLSLKEDEKGLWCEFEFFNDPAVPEADKAYFLAKQGVLDSFSIGFKPEKAGWLEDEEMKGGGVYQIHRLKLYEISLVTFPMNEGAVVTSLKEELMANKPEGQQSLSFTVEVKNLDKVLVALEQIDQKLDSLLERKEEVLDTQPEVIEDHKEDVVEVEVKEDVEPNVEDDLDTFNVLKELSDKLSKFKSNILEDK